MKKIALFVVVAIAALLITHVVANKLGAQRRSNPISEEGYKRALARAERAPQLAYSLEFELVVTKDGEPGEMPGQRGRQIVRANGEEAKETQMFRIDGSPASTMREILIEGARLDVRDELRIFNAVQYKIAALNAIHRLDPETSCTATFAGQLLHNRTTATDGTMLGHRVVELLYAEEGKNFATTLWMAPDLGCLTLRRLVHFAAAGPGKPAGTNEYRVTAVTVGESTDDALFAVPVDYVQVGRGELIERHAARVGGRVHAAEREHLAQLDLVARERPADLSRLRRR